MSVIRSLQGIVVSDAMEKSRILRIQRLVKHPNYKKYVKRTTKIIFHDEENVSRVGDKVLIQPCRPYSKRKNFKLREVLQSAGSNKQ